MSAQIDSQNLRGNLKNQGHKESLFKYQSLSRVVLQELRGDRSQKEMSQKIGLTFNQWHKWESGQKTLMWADLKKIAKYLKLDIEKSLHAILHENLSSDDNGGELIAKFLKNYGVDSPSFLADKLGINRTSLYRMTTTKRHVSAAFVFQCLGELSSILPFFLNSLIERPQTESLKIWFSSIQQQVSLEGAFPWISSVEAFLETTEYAQMKTHDDAAVAKRLGLSGQQVQVTLQTLLKSGSVERNAEQGHAKYSLVRKRIDLEADIFQSAKFAHFWNSVSACRFVTSSGVPRSGQGWSSRVFPASEKARQQINQLRKKFLSDVNEVLQSDCGDDKKYVQVLLTHYFDQDEFREIIGQFVPQNPETDLMTS